MRFLLSTLALSLITAPAWAAAPRAGTPGAPGASGAPAAPAAPAAAPTAAPAPAQRPAPAVAPAAPGDAPSVDELKALLAQQKYSDVLRGVAKCMSIKGPAAQNYDRY